MTDILDLIDEATSCQRDGCGQPLGTSPSGDFCSPSCQQRWHEARSDLFAGYEPAEHDDLSGDFYIHATPAALPPVSGYRCSHGGCRRPASGSAPCSLHAGGPPYIRTLSRSSRGPSYTIVEFDAVAVDAGRGLRGATAALAFVDEMAAAAVATTDALRDAGVLPKELPTDPRERALELRRHRNTGPQQRQRAPRRINPRGCL